MLFVRTILEFPEQGRLGCAVPPARAAGDLREDVGDVVKQPIMWIRR